MQLSALIVFREMVPIKITYIIVGLLVFGAGIIYCISKAFFFFTDFLNMNLLNVILFEVDEIRIYGKKIVN